MKGCLFALLLVGLQGNATILFNDLGTGSSVYDGSNGSQFSGSGAGSWITQARPFTVSGSGDFLLTQIDLGVVNYGPSAPTFTAGIWTNSSNQPGVELGSSWNLSTTEQINNCCALVTQSGITGITLTGGVQYWMVLGPRSSSDNSRNSWADNTQGVQSNVLGSLDGGATWIPDTPGTAAAFEVIGNAAPSGAPEPSSWLLLGTGLFAAIMARRR